MYKVKLHILVFFESVLLNIYYILAAALARSLHDMSCANNNRFAVVVCPKRHFVPQEWEKNKKISI